MTAMALPRARVAMTVNGRPVEGEAEPRTHLADFLRETLLLTGTHLGCEQGVCGACTVMVDGQPVRACLTLAVACEGADVRSIEGFDDDALMARLRDAFSRHHGLQCGYCTPGMLTTAYDIVRRLPGADRERIRRELSGNLCRCTGYAGAVAAVEDVLAGDPPAAAVQPLPRRAPVASAPVVSAPAAIAAAAPPVATPAAAITPPGAVEGGTQLTRELDLAMSPEALWAQVSDIPTMVAAIPGAALAGPVEDNRARGTVTVALGPLRAHFDGAADFALDPATRSGEALGRGVDRLTRSSVDGALSFAVEPGADAGSARLALAMRYGLRGPLAQVGRPAIVAEIADRILGDTAAALEARATGTVPGTVRGTAPGTVPGTVTPEASGPLRLLPLLRALLAGIWKGRRRRR
ncbi:MAG: 2Fe-2S iron-sulfur cluster-binding protein [Pseudomonadota bacterium]